MPALKIGKIGLTQISGGWLLLPSPWVRYVAAILLAVAAQIARLPLHPSTIMPFITYAPFMVVSAVTGGLGPGLLTTAICALESAYFAVEPLSSFAIRDAVNWIGMGALLLTGVVASVLVERLKRASVQLAESHVENARILESISDGFITFDRDWRHTYVNTAGAKMLGKTREELLGLTLWEVWPKAAESPFQPARLRAVRENVQVQVEAFYPEPLNAWFELRCYPTADGLTQFFTNTSDRRLGEERLRLLESAILQTSDAVLILKAGGADLCDLRPLFVNPAFERITGFRLEDLQPEVLRVLCGSRIAPADHRELLLRRKDTSDFWAEVDLKPLISSDSDYTHWVWTCRDITGRKLADEASQLLGSIVECSDDAILSENLMGMILSWNRGAERIYGYSSEEMVGRSVSLLVPPDRRQEFAAVWRQLKLGQGVDHLETERLTKSGQRIFVSATLSPLRDRAGKVVGGAAIARDITERKRVEKALEASEQRYRSLANATNQIVWMTNAAGQVEEPAPTWLEFTGQSADEMKGSGWLAALHPDDREWAAEAWMRAVSSHSLYTVEYRLRRNDGEYRFMVAHGVPVLEDTGAVREWVGTCTDVTERRQAEEQFRTLANAIPQLCWMANADGSIFWFNERWYQYTGTSPGQMEGWGWQSVHDPEVLPKVLERWNKSIETGKPFDMVFPLRGADGIFRPFLTRVMPVCDADDKVARWFGTNTDISDQRRIEEALRESQARLNAALASTTDAVFISDAHGRFVNFNHAFATFHKFRNKDECYRTFAEYPGTLEVFFPDGTLAPENMWAVPRALRGETVANAEYLMRRKDTGETWVGSYSFSPIRSKEGVIVGSVVVGRDVTERKQAEQQIKRLNEDLERRVAERTAELQVSNKELESFAYSVSHDLRAPLRAVDGFSRILLEEYAPELCSEVQRYLNIVRKNAVQMGELIDRLLALSRLGRQALRKEPVDFRSLVRQVLEELAPDQDGRQIEIVVGDLPVCEADPGLLKQVFVNLLSNALKYTRRREQARIEIGSFVTPQDRPAMFVRDNGTGFDMRYADKLFGVFQRLHSAEEYEGTGVGLAIVHRIVTRHGGRVWAEAAVDKGAAFYFSLPCGGSADVSEGTAASAADI
jgi:PAS domain S-box-containing protein